MLKTHTRTEAALCRIRLLMLITVLALSVSCGREEALPKIVSVSASSNLFPSDERYSPQYLLEDKKTIWHAAESTVNKPQWINIDYCMPARISGLGIMAQDSTPKGAEHKRAPKDFVFQGSNDGKTWTDLLTVADNTYDKGGEWKEWTFKNSREFLSYRIYITRGGEQNPLTIRQISLK